MDVRRMEQCACNSLLRSKRGDSMHIAVSAALSGPACSRCAFIRSFLLSEKPTRRLLPSVHLLRSSTRELK